MSLNLYPMKKRLLAKVFMLFALFLALSFTQKPVKRDENSVQCKGYTVIASGIGVDCHGDTLQLVKHNGFYERVR